MITRYHRPVTMDEALGLMEHPGTFVLGGGTSIVASGPTGEAVDIQALALDTIESDGRTVRMGTTALLTDIATSPDVPPMLRELAHREAPNTIRNAATIGGTIGANEPESELLAGLVAYGATATVSWSREVAVHPVADILTNPNLIERAIITAIEFDPTGTAASHRTGRTPMDRPIVMVAGHKGTDGHIQLAMTGAADHVVAVSPGQAGEVSPPSDFRGTSEYRRSLAVELTKRVLADIAGGEQS